MNGIIYLVGLVVVVIGFPHRVTNTCAQCGQEVTDYFVEVSSDNPKFNAVPGPHYYPISWLKVKMRLN